MGGIIQEEAALSLACAEVTESANHLLLVCPSAWVVWSMVYKWFRLTTVLPISISSLLDGFLSIYRNGKQGLQGVLMVWHSVVWVLWPK
ncbi:hypothetical protein QL285_051291 [Trifolium repens]|jgi:hypothetical protein|nr:hypothetical protein QL285_051291 [Trifolium repens]